MSTVSTPSTPPNRRGHLGVVGAARRAGLLRRILASAVLVAAIAVGAPSIAAADFAGSYALDNWTFANTNADGSVVPSSGTATSITITGGDNGSLAFGATNFTVAAAATGTVSFSWSYSSVDLNTFDLAGFCKPIVPNLDPCAVDMGNVNSTADNLILIATNAESGASGTFSETVAAGDIFGFSVVTADNIFGPGVLTISDFFAPEPASGGEENETSVALPPTLGLLAVGLAVSRFVRRKRRASR